MGEPAPAPAPPPESAEMVQEILLKLPTRDVIRCCCVSKLWRGVVADPTFRTLQAEAEADHVSSAPPNALLVTVTPRPVSSLKPMALSRKKKKKKIPMALPHRVTIPSGYRLSNLCNGLLCFSLVRDSPEALSFICNPVTGETATVPKAPPPVGLPSGTVYHHFALAFSPSTKEHKLFRFTFSPFYGFYGDNGDNVDQSVFTLDGAAGSGGWRQHSFRSQCPLLLAFRPLLIQGKLYLVTTSQTRPEKRQNPGGLIEVNVATEACRTHRLPFEADEYHPLVNACEMSGRLCLAVDIVRAYETIVRKIQFWVLILRRVPTATTVRRIGSCAIASMPDGDYVLDVPRSAWFDNAEMALCYKDYEVLYKHGTRGRSPEPSPDADCPQCDRRIQLPPTPSNCQWNIFGGYRPSLLSPLALPPPPSSWDGEEERQKFEHALLLTLE
ncbi:hypothetical protein VPH35_114699 [Triticum aestivum]